MSFKLSNIAKEGYNLIAIFAIVTIILFFVSHILGFLGVILTSWCIFFFRDPNRVTPQADNLVIAPADGKVVKVELVQAPEETGLDSEVLKISIFMNVFSVHVNRSPCIGQITKIKYIAGSFFNADLDKASEQNERQIFTMETASKKNIAFVQVAGLVARRIVKFIPENIAVKAGEKVGLIKFGSRVDIYLPAETIPSVHIGQSTIAGETVIADFNNNSPQPASEVLDRANQTN